MAAVMGGGISGLVCAARLFQLGITNSVMSDIRKHGQGGSCISMDSGVAHICDHTVQFFTVSNPKLAKIVSFLPAKDAVKVWNDPTVELKQGTGPKEVIGLPAFVSRGIQSVSMCLAGLVHLNGNLWGSRV